MVFFCSSRRYVGSSYVVLLSSIIERITVALSLSYYGVAEFFCCFDSYTVFVVMLCCWFLFLCRSVSFRFVSRKMKLVEVWSGSWLLLISNLVFLDLRSGSNKLCFICVVLIRQMLLERVWFVVAPSWR